MKTTIEVDVPEFFVPEVLKCSIGEMKENIPLSQLSAETLDALCRKFKIDVFEIAGKNLPPGSLQISQRGQVAMLLSDISAEFNHVPPWDIKVVRIKLEHALALLKE